MKAIACIACERKRLGKVWNTANVCPTCRDQAIKLLKYGFSLNETFLILNYGRYLRQLTRNVLNTIENGEKFDYITQFSFRFFLK